MPIAFALVLAYHYPRWVATRQSLGQYFDGVYRSRVLGREAILGIANAVDGLVGSRSGATPGFAVGWVIVTIGGLLLAWWLFRVRLRAQGSDAGRRDVVLVALMAVSATVLTPYDYLSYALIIATVLAAERGRTGRAVVLMVAAMATRESAFLVLPILAAERLSSPSADSAARSKRWRHSLADTVTDPRWLAVGAAGGATYLVLKVGLRPAKGVTLFQGAPWADNLGWGAVGGIALAVTLVVVARSVFGRGGDRLLIDRRRLMWLVSLPYLVVLFIGSSWGEAPRLVMPMVIGEALLATAAGCTPYPPSCGPGGGAVSGGSVVQDGLQLGG